MDNGVAYCNKYVESLQNIAPELESKKYTTGNYFTQKPEFIAKTIDKTKTSYSVLYDENYKIAELFDVLYIPERKNFRPIRKTFRRRFQKKPFRRRAGRLPFLLLIY